MNIYIDNEKLNFSRDSFEFIGDGMEGEVYRNDNLALKLYHNIPRKDTIDLETTRAFTYLDTERILLPKKVIYDDNHNMIGYATLYKENYNHALKLIKGDKFVEEISIIKDDIDLLSHKDILVNDLHRDNMIYDGSIYLVDPGSYYFNIDNTDVYNHNNNEFNRFLFGELIDYELKQVTSLKKAKAIRDILTSDGFDSIKSDLGNSKNLRSYVNNLVKRH